MSAPKSTAKKETKASVAAADRPIVLSKFKKQKRATAAKKSRTVQVKHVKKFASKKMSRRVAEKAAVKEDAAETARLTSKSELPPEVANARAQAIADDQARNIAALDSAKVSTVNGVLVAANEQPADTSAPADNAVAAQEAAPPPPPLPSNKIIRAMPSGDKPVVRNDDSDPWSKTSLIGKIFIAFGSLLTLASAARLIIA